MIRPRRPRRPLRALPILITLGLSAVPARAADPLPSPRATFRTVATPNFTVVGDVSARKLAETGERLERFRAALARMKPQAPPRAAVPTLVLAFEGERSFRPYRILDRPDTRGYSGVFHTTRWGNYMAFDAQAGEDPLSTVYAGYIYFFIDAHYPSTPLWLAKGLAEYYETFRAAGDAVQIGRPSESHVRYLRGGWRIPLARVLEIRRDSPEYLDRDQYGSYSAHCWALVHYLLVGGEGLAPRVPDLLARLDRGETLAAAAPAALGLSAAELEARLRLYAKQPIFKYETWRLGDLAAPEVGEAIELPRAQALALLGEYLAHARAAEPARLHLEAVLAAEPGNADALALLGFLAAGAEQSAEAAAYYERALAGTPRRAVSAVHAGFHAWERGRTLPDGSAEARAAYESAAAAARRARELDPEFAEAFGLEGLAALNLSDPTAALVAFSEAQLRLPGRGDIAYNRFLAALQAGQTAIARGIATGSLARLDPEAARRAQAELAERGRWAAGQRRVDAYNRAITLANEGRLADARHELTALLADCPDAEPVCGAARGLAEQLDRQLQQDR